MNGARAQHESGSAIERLAARALRPAVRGRDELVGVLVPGPAGAAPDPQRSPFQSARESAAPSRGVLVEGALPAARPGRIRPSAAADCAVQAASEDRPPATAPPSAAPRAGRVPTVEPGAPGLAAPDLEPSVAGLPAALPAPGRLAAELTPPDRMETREPLGWQALTDSASRLPGSTDEAAPPARVGATRIDVSPSFAPAAEVPSRRRVGAQSAPRPAPPLEPVGRDPSPPAPSVAAPAVAPPPRPGPMHVSIDRIDVITPPARAPERDPFASLADRRTGASRHGRAR
jgi:hypothetical protein